MTISFSNTPKKWDKETLEQILGGISELWNDREEKEKSADAAEQFGKEDWLGQLDGVSELWDDMTPKERAMATVNPRKNYL